MSLRRRIIVGFVAVALVLIASNVALASTFHSFLLHRVDQQLVTSGDSLGRGRPDLNGGSTLTEYYVASLDTATGQVTHYESPFEAQRPSPKLTAKTLNDHIVNPGDAPKPWTTTAVSGSGKWRMIAQVDPRDGDVTLLGLSLDGLQATLVHMREIQILGSLAVLAALGFVSFWVMRLGVLPVAAMAHTAEQISEGDLSLRVDHPDPATEVGRLGASFNRMLDRIQEAFRARAESEAKVRRFAADASHELRTPLTSIRGYAELYRAGALSKSADLKDAMGRIEAEAERMGSLVEELLQLARLDQEQPMEFSNVNLGEIANDAVNDARAVEPDRPITVAVAGGEPIVVRGNDPALRQVMSNLLGNVRAHTPPQTPATVTVSRNGKFVTIAVSDEGPGMPEDVAAHAFERFYRADAARTRAAGGSGLGLSIVESIARAHGGEATVTSAPGKGTRFEVKLPVST
ncbi:MAG TPA: HAMP domain-containing sensor histidine kinase [Acidimicrobiales bacterium]|nr:HAMP domain-containing sensor histidine kinase [Acidimicrobiales bacterium]